jgi:hypothetical protein
MMIKLRAYKSIDLLSINTEKSKTKARNWQSMEGKDKGSDAKLFLLKSTIYLI